MGRLRYDSKKEKHALESEYTINSFPYDNPVNTIIEIGTGKGEMITQMAQLNPNNFYIGIEKYAVPASYAIKKAEKLELKNIKFIIGDALELQSYFKNKISKIWLTFSDPWPKKRHASRRLSHENFLKLYQNILDENRIVHFKSDNNDLYEYTLESLNNFGANVIEKTTDINIVAHKINNIQTGYEKKFSSKGKNINYIKFKF
ncbi:tRNA (guanosine(46)-N7)-methyltransferase TrmB [Mycoplasma testudineum]|nr:tRNA (guanosine(46)-N7)-methyltransferase TrmB [Mycoplasma testudineum]